MFVLNHISYFKKNKTKQTRKRTLKKLESLNKNTVPHKHTQRHMHRYEQEEQKRKMH